MSQSDIIKILEKLGDNEWMTSSVLYKMLGVNRSTVITNLGKLRKYGEVESRQIRLAGIGYENEHRLTNRGRGI